jgi:type IV pilus assembly protein PilX
MMRHQIPTQRGSTLVVALVMLLVMTILGLSSMDITIMGEKMAGNHKNKEASFEAAELALRDGEAAAAAGKRSDESAGEAIGGHIDAGKDDSTATTDAAWADASVEWADIAAEEMEHVAEQPVYISEKLPRIESYTGCGKLTSAEDSGDCWLIPYRVTGQGWGSNANANSMVQSTVITRKAN